MRKESGSYLCTKAGKVAREESKSSQTWDIQFLSFSVKDSLREWLGWAESKNPGGLQFYLARVAGGWSGH